MPQSFLAARRLVEAGARVVTFNYSKWDWHGHPYGSCFDRCREDLGVFDQGFSALIEDLHDRGLDEGRDRGRVGRVRPHADDQ